MEKKVLISRNYTLQYLGVMEHQISDLLSKDSGKKLFVLFLQLFCSMKLRKKQQRKKRKKPPDQQATIQCFLVILGETCSPHTSEVFDYRTHMIAGNTTSLTEL